MRYARQILESGFTLIELLVVLVVLAIAASMVTLSLSAAGRGYALETAAERLAVALETARWQAISTSRRMAWEAPPTANEPANGSTQEGRWYEQARDGAWQLRVTEPVTGYSVVSVTLLQPRPSDGAPARLLLGPEPVGVPACVLLTQERDSMTIVSDGVAPFSVRRDARC